MRRINPQSSFKKAGARTRAIGGQCECIRRQGGTTREAGHVRILAPLQREADFLSSQTDVCCVLGSVRNDGAHQARIPCSFEIPLGPCLWPRPIRRKAFWRRYIFNFKNFADVAFLFLSPVQRHGKSSCGSFPALICPLTLCFQRFGTESNSHWLRASLFFFFGSRLADLQILFAPFVSESFACGKGLEEANRTPPRTRKSRFSHLSLLSTFYASGYVLHRTKKELPSGLRPADFRRRFFEEKTLRHCCSW